MTEPALRSDYAWIPEGWWEFIEPFLAAKGQIVRKNKGKALLSLWDSKRTIEVDLSTSPQKLAGWLEDNYVQMSESQSFAAELKQRRLAKGMTQIELHQAAGYPRPDSNVGWFVSELERGRPTSNEEALTKMLTALDWTPTNEQLDEALRGDAKPALAPDVKPYQAEPKPVFVPRSTTSPRLEPVRSTPVAEAGENQWIIGKQKTHVEMAREIPTGVLMMELQRRMDEIKSVQAKYDALRARVKALTDEG